jgi:hypothetical protein
MLPLSECKEAQARCPFAFGVFSQFNTRNLVGVQKETLYRKQWYVQLASSTQEISRHAKGKTIPKTMMCALYGWKVRKGIKLGGHLSYYGSLTKRYVLHFLDKNTLFFQSKGFHRLMEEEEVVLITRDSILFLLTIHRCIHGQDFLFGTSQKSNSTQM